MCAVAAADDPQELLDHIKTMEFVGRAPTTIKQRAYIIRALHRFLNGQGVGLYDATEAVLLAWTRTVEHRGDHGRRNAVTHCQSFYRWALWADHVSADPSVRLPRPSYRQGLPRPIGRNDLDVALKAAPERIRPWLLLAVDCGLRASEIAHLTRADMMLDEEPPLIIVHGKGGKLRAVPVTPTVAEALSRCPRRGPLFPRLDGQAGGVTPARVSSAANLYLHQLGITSTLHTLRHRAASDLQREVGDIRITQTFLGHANPSTTAGYAKISNSVLNSAVLRVAAARAEFSRASDADGAPVGA